MSYPVKKSSKKKLFITLIVILFISAVFVAGFTIYKQNKSSNNQNTDVSQETSSNINFDPPTEEEQQSGNMVKEEVDTPTQSQNQSPRPENQKQSVDVVITDASQYGNDIEVRAFTPDILQEGECVITFTKGEHSLRKNAPAHPDATTTICTNPAINRDEFPASGEWTVVVSFTSRDAQGKSESRTINIE